MTVRRTSSRAFTLVELLVVIGIISLLVALLLPAVLKARQQALATKCAANLRTMGQALTMYTQQFGRYPSCWVVDSDTPGRWAIWPVRLRWFLGGGNGVFHCPAQEERFEWKKGQPPAGLRLVPASAGHAQLGYEVGEPLLEVERAPFSYAYNAEGESLRGHGTIMIGWGLGMYVRLEKGRVWGPQLRAGRVKAPSQMIAITDASADAWYDAASFPSALDARLWPGNVHNGGANVLFCDGHVQWYPQKALLVSPTGPTPEDIPIRRMWNNDNQP